MPTCNLPFLPSSESGELIWECPGTTNIADISAVRAYKVYPTITSDHLTIETTDQNFWRIVVYDAYGRSLYQTPASGSVVELDVHTWPPGFLYIQIISYTGMQMEKVLKIE